MNVRSRPGKHAHPTYPNESKSRGKGILRPTTYHNAKLSLLYNDNKAFYAEFVVGEEVQNHRKEWQSVFALEVDKKAYQHLKAGYRRNPNRKYDVKVSETNRVDVT